MPATRSSGDRWADGESSGLVVSPYRRDGAGGVHKYSLVLIKRRYAAWSNGVLNSSGIGANDVGVAYVERDTTQVCD